ncbi:MAG: Asp-tRNA(Asn)/Glu-tRNA(Gln) amidotransferase subunit GatA [Candidatus Melainabacteria bacterium]|nr:Asp-tRNA(Asn)/Glu-tRNA(Gln) amidotransferase subunit GatA [Candidatus Melainabacteria bacterium]
MGWSSIASIRQALADKSVSARDIAQSCMARVESEDGTTNAFLSVTADLALSQADRIDAMIASGEPLPLLAGVPVCLKDNICVAGYPTTCASKILGDFKPPYSATVAERLFAAGAVCIGKGNMDEFAMGSSSENTAFAVPTNPHDPGRVAGGSSGGPAIAVAKGYSTIGIGSDTGGSIRLPASFCGVVGMKPTYGLVSRYGLVAYASSLDQIGPFAGCVEDAATVLGVIYGGDSRDSTCLSEPFAGSPETAPGAEFAARLEKLEPASVCRDLKIGIIGELFGEGVEPAVRDACKRAVASLAGAGARVEEISLPHLEHALPVYYLVATAEASANLARFDGIRYGVRQEGEDLVDLYSRSRAMGFGDEVKLRIMLGTYALSSGYYDAYYKKAQQVRRLIKEDFDRIFADYDVLVSPTSPEVAFAIGEKTDDPLKMYLSDIATIPVNLAGLPSLSIPCGMDSRGLPIGLQIMGPQLADALVLRVARALELCHDYCLEKSS